MAKSRSNDFMSTLRAQGLRKRVAKALSDLEGGSRGATGRAEKLARQAITDLRAAADSIEKRLDIGGVGTRSRAGKKAAATRKRAAAKRSSAAKRGAKRRTGSARKTASKAAGTARKAASSARKTSTKKSSARKTTRRKTTGRKTARKRSS
jgi:hypothetical protein